MGLDDHDRPLNGRGRRAAPYMGELLAQKGLVPDIMISSSALRAVDTAKAVAQASGFLGPIEVTRRLYLAEPSSYLEVLSESGGSADCVLILGHNPGISELVGVLTGNDVDMPTAALARIDLEVSDLALIDERTQGALVGFWRPPKDDKKSKG